MKKYVKVKVVAKNNPQGSYAAGCPTDKNKQGSGDPGSCSRCDRAQ